MLKTTETISLSADIRDERGTQRVMLHATYGQRTLDMRMEVLDSDYVAQNRQAVEADVAQFMREALARAAANGLPCTVAGDA